MTNGFRRADNPNYQDATVTLYAGDCLDVLRELPDNSVDSVVTDPPYNLAFMGKEWDAHVTAAAFQAWCQLWATECLRVLKPGGHMLAFGGTRTSHRLACAIEDAGFEIRDSIAWLYGSGFPKSRDVSKAIDATIVHGKSNSIGLREAGESRQSLGVYASRPLTTGNMFNDANPTSTIGMGDRHLTVPTTPEAQQWAGWGTALKPAHEPIVVARKPIVGTVAGNVLRHGTGALNIDASRISGGDVPAGRTRHGGGIPGAGSSYELPDSNGAMPAGRWPANVVLDESQADALDQMSGETNSPAPYVQQTTERGEVYGLGSLNDKAGKMSTHHGDSGGASRFFYTAKASSDERVTYTKPGGGNGDLEYAYKVKTCDTCGRRFSLTEAQPCGHDGWSWQERLDRKSDTIAHPTVKPLALMRWLVRLVTPPGGTVLEPFAGSGTTVEACILEGFRCVAIEREPDYLPLITQRIHRRRDPIAYITAAGEDLGLFGLAAETDA